MVPDLSVVAAELAARHPAIRLVVLHGSRARGDAHAGSDWDLGYLGDGVDHLLVMSHFVSRLGTDDVDVVDLAGASALLRFKAAAEGRCLYQRTDDHEQFVLQATDFWCDVGPVIRRAGEAVLSGLGA